MEKLKLVLKKKWYDMIASGEKTEEYREITPYWCNRLLYGCNLGVEGYWNVVLQNTFNMIEDFNRYNILKNNNLQHYLIGNYGYRDYPGVIFYMGYAKNRPSITKEIVSISIGKGKEEWGAEPDKEYFIIKLK